MIPDDWESWLVRADELSIRGDDRGQLLVLEHRGGADRAHAWQLADAWMATSAEQLGESTLELYLWIRSLAPIVDPPTPELVLPTFARPISQLLAQLDRDATYEAGEVAPVFAQYREQVLAAMRAWIDRAFDGVPPPDEDHRTLRQGEAADNHDMVDRSLDHLGRWQDLPDRELLECQWALSHLDAQGIRYYAPAVMTFALRQGVRWHQHWITESFEYTLQRSSEALRAYQLRRFELLDRAQRAAIYAYTLVAGHVEAAKAWAPVFEAERTAERPDWFELYWPS